jgi:LacI family transcriptional regulator
LWEFCQERLNEYTALFFASDFYASDAVFIFQSQGIRVPQDISVVGFDDNLFAEHCRPMLTTVQQHVADKAFYAFALLQRLIRGEECIEKNIHLPVKLVIRESVQPLEP